MTHSIAADGAVSVAEIGIPQIPTAAESHSQGLSNDSMTSRHQVDIKLEDAEWFGRAEHEWRELMGRSQANPLFMGWVWQSIWWQSFSTALSAELTMLTARDPGGTLRGIAPLMKLSTHSRRPLPAVQLAPIGNVWRLNQGEVTEHVDWIVDTEYANEVSSRFESYLENSDNWHELLLSYTYPESIAAVALEKLATRLDCYVRREKALPLYAVDASMTFDEFLETLGANTRKRLFGRRTLLRQTGEIRRVVADSGNIATQLDKLDVLSRKRWGTGFSETSRRFFERLSSRLLSDGTLRFSTLEVDGQPISSLYDVDADGVTYNIRSAIDTTFHPRLSPGLLHLGLEIERACERAEIHRYSLLAGGGKSSDYKRDITKLTEHFTSIQLVRRRHEKTLYRFYDRLRRVMRG